MNKLYIEKPRRVEKLSKDKQEDLVFDLFNAIIEAKSLDEAALFLQDLLTKAEIKMLSKRLRIAKLLLDGMTYHDVGKELHVSYGTVAKISVWLSQRGEGFRAIIKKIPSRRKEELGYEFSEWSKLKKRYPMYFWPELLLDEIIKTANNKQKKTIASVLSKLEGKNDLHRHIEKLLYKNI